MKILFRSRAKCSVTSEILFPTLMLGLVATICSANAEWTEVDVNDIDSNVLILL